MADENFFDPQQIDESTRGLEGLTYAMAGFSDATDVAEQRARKLTREADRLDERWRSFTVRTLHDYDRTIGLMTERMEFFSKGSIKELDALERRWKQWGSEVQRQVTQARRGLGVAGSAMGVSGGFMGRSGAFQGSKNAMQGLLGSMPFGTGGLIGLMLYGKKREAEISAQGNKVVRIFDQIGGVGRREAKTLTSDVVKLQYAFGNWGQEMAQTAESFVKLGMGRELFEKAGGGLSGGRYGDSMLQTTVAAEAAYRMQPGSLAQSMGQVYQQGGTQRRELLSDFMQLAQYAEMTNQNVGVLIGTMTQSASSMRVQRQGVADLGDAYKSLYSSLGAGPMAGSPRQAIGAAASSGIGQLAQGIGGLPMGLSSFLGNRMGMGSNGVDTYIQFMEGGKSGGQGKFFSEVVGQLGQLAEEIGGPSREGQIFSLMQVAPLPFEAARAAVMINRGEGGDSQLFAEGLKSPMERLNDAFQKRSSEENQWARTQERLLLQMSSIGVSTLNVVTQGFSTITTILMALVPGSSTTFGDAQRASVQFHTVQDKFLSSLSKNLRGMMGAGATGLGVEMPDFLKRHEKEKQDQAAKSRERNEKENYHFRRDFQKVQNIIGQMGGSENLSDLQQKRLRSEILQRRKKAQESGRAVDVALATEQGVKAAGIPYEKDGLRIRLVVERSDKRGEDMF